SCPRGNCAPVSSPDPARTDLTGVARDAQTLADVIARLEQAGYRSQFAIPRESPPDAGRISCLVCRTQSHPPDVRVDALLRLEGASEPDEMLAIAALVCPQCGARGSLVVNYGPLGDAQEMDPLGDTRVDDLPTSLLTVEILGTIPDRATLDHALAGWE